MARVMKDSGIEWIGQIPEDWETSKIGQIYSERNEKVSDYDYEPLSVTMQGIVPQLSTAAKSDAHDDRKLVKKGDFAINSRSDRRGSCGISPMDGSVSLINTILKPHKDMNPDYYNWVFHSTMFSDEFYKWGHGIVNDLWTTRWQDMKKISIPSPQIDEQQKITTFLDEKCASIDAVIEKTKASIEEYKKLKQAIITRAVTKGIRPDQETVESGYSFIGEVSSCSEICRLKKMVDITDGTHDTPSYVDKENDTYPLVTSKCIEGGHIHVDLANHISKYDYEEINKRSKVNVFDVIMPMIGTVGNPALITESSDFAIKNVALMKTRGDELLGKYLCYFLNSSCVTIQFELINRGGVQNFISQDKLKNIIVVNHNNIGEIVDYLDDKCSKIDTIIENKEKVIEDQTLYKKSLIYEYITGKKEVV